MITIYDFLWGVVVPSLIATAFAAVGWRLWRFNGEGLSPAPWAAPLGMGLGVAVGIVGLMASNAGTGFVASIPWPPRASFHWLPWIAFAGVALAVAGIVPERVGLWLHAVLGIALVVFAATVIVFLRQRARLGDGAALGLAGAMVVAAALVAASNEVAARRLPGWLIPLHMTIVGTALAVALGATGTVKIAQYAGVLCAATGPWIVAGLIRREFRFSTGGIAVFVALASSLVMSGVLYSKLPVGAAILLALAAVAPVVALVPVGETRAWWLRPALAGGATMLLVAATLIAVMLSPAAAGGGG